MSKALRSGELAEAAGVNVQTLRYYERRGLLPDPGRTLGGHREYGPEAVTALRVIRGLARLGFTLDEISELVEVGSHRVPARACAPPPRSWPRSKRRSLICTRSGPR